MSDFVQPRATTAENNGEYVDLLVIEDDIALDDSGAVRLVDGRPSITQDLQHMIRESGLLVELVGERDAETRHLNLIRIVELIETDTRIEPGTARITPDEGDRRIRYQVTAQTVDYQHLGFWL